MTRIFTKKKRPVLEFVGNLVLILSIAAAIIYELKSFPNTEIWSLVAKGMPVFLLGIYAAINIRTVDHAILAIALFASTVGDVALALPEPDSFQRGIMGFTAAHLCFIILFLRNRRVVSHITRIRINLASLCWAATTIAAILLYDTLGAMQYMVIGYMVILTGMVSAAQISRYPFVLVGVGSILFYISDGLLAGGMFLGLPEWTGTLVWISYYLAQFLITMGVLIAPDKERRYQVKTF